MIVASLAVESAVRYLLFSGYAIVTTGRKTFGAGLPTRDDGPAESFPYNPETPAF
jgi:hypothetical protein